MGVDLYCRCGWVWGFGGLDLVTIVGLALGFNGDSGFWFRGWVSVATVDLCLGFNSDSGFGFGIQQ